jgi:hypothetical protein
MLSFLIISYAKRISLKLRASHYSGGFHNRGGVTRIRATATNVACKRLTAIFFGRSWIPGKKRLGRYYKAGRTVAALHSVPLAVRINKRFPFGIGRNAFNRLNLLSFALDGKHCAGQHRAPVNDDSAGAARAAVAHLFRSGKPKSELKRALESPMGFYQHFDIFAVYIELLCYGIFYSGKHGGGLRGKNTGCTGSGSGSGCLWGRHCQAGAQSSTGYSNAGIFEETAAVNSASFRFIVFCFRHITKSSWHLENQRLFRIRPSSTKIKTSLYQPA